MDNKEVLRKMRAAQFFENNGRVLRIINILRHKFEQLKGIKYALDELDEAEFLDSINFLAEAEYIKLRDIISKAPSQLEDTDYKELEAKVTEKGIRLLGGETTDKMVKV